ncbi:MAG: HEAT repeat domain-containing protein [Planctomycetaceae bacterium]
MRPILILHLLAGAASASSLAHDVARAFKAGDPADRAKALRAAEGRVQGLGPAESAERDRAAAAVEKAMRDEPSPAVRSAALDLLLALGTERALDRLVTGALDPDPEVRAHLRELLRDNAAPALHDAVARALREDASWRMRAAMAGLATASARRGSIPPLLEALGDPHPAVVAAAAEALERLTGKAYGADASAWRRHFEEEARRTPPPAPGETRTVADTARKVELYEGPIRGLVPTLFTLPITAKRVLLVVDISSSTREGPRQGQLDELKRALFSLPSDVEINVLCFDQRQFFFTSAKSLAACDLWGKVELERWLDNLPAGEKTDVTRSVAAGLAMLREALKDEESDSAELFILTDGRETVTSMPPGAMEAQFERLPSGRCRVHVIALGGHGVPAPLARLAAASGGQTVQAAAR